MLWESLNNHNRTHRTFWGSDLRGRFGVLVHLNSEGLLGYPSKIRSAMSLPVRRFGKRRDSTIPSYWDGV